MNWPSDKNVRWDNPKGWGGTGRGGSVVPGVSASTRLLASADARKAFIPFGAVAGKEAPRQSGGACGM